jgi:predicted ATP-dependent endonuclease of OLD family
MQIVYLFIKEFKKIKNQNLNFGSEYIFDYSEERKILSIQKNELYINGHYKTNENEFAEILNVTSIIGQNGTGKTTILEFFRTFFNNETNLTKEVIIAIKNEEGFSIYHTESLSFELEEPNSNFKIKQIKKFEDITISNNREPQSITSQEYFHEFEGFENTDLIYFSNVFDAPNWSYINYQGLKDISTNTLIVSDYKTEVENKIIHLEKKQNSLYSFFNNELHRQIKFLVNYYNSTRIPFDLPDHLDISIKKDFFIEIDREYFENKIDNNLFKDHIKNLKRSIFKPKIETNDLKIKLIINIYLSFLVDLIHSYSFLVDNGKMLKIIKNEVFNNSVELLIKNLKSILIFLKPKIPSEIEIYFDNIISIIEEINKIDNEEREYLRFDPTGFFLILNNTTFKSFEKFVNNYSNSYIIRPFLNFEWRGISSGENAMLNIFSRFHSITDKELIGDELNTHLIILIDEADVYLHPEWQKKFVKILIDFLPMIFAKKRDDVKRTIQIIFTTNSPIPVSDILSYNTIFLENKKDDTGISYTIVKDSLNEQKETFAANIHTLLSDSFFVKGGLIGDFASDKLNKIIDQLIKRTELSKEERENMRKLIYQVGEPVLKSKLMQMYNERYNMDIHERLDSIEKRLDNDKN